MTTLILLIIVCLFSSLLSYVVGLAQGYTLASTQALTAAELRRKAAAAKACEAARMASHRAMAAEIKHRRPWRAHLDECAASRTN